MPRLDIACEMVLFFFSLFVEMVAIGPPPSLPLIERGTDFLRSFSK